NCRGDMRRIDMKRREIAMQKTLDERNLRYRRCRCEMLGPEHGLVDTAWRYERREVAREDGRTGAAGRNDAAKRPFRGRRDRGRTADRKRFETDDAGDVEDREKRLRLRREPTTVAEIALGELDRRHLVIVDAGRGHVVRAGQPLDETVVAHGRRGRADIGRERAIARDR